MRMVRIIWGVYRSCEREGESTVQRLRRASGQDSTYRRRGLQDIVVHQGCDRPEGRPVEIESKVVVDHGVHVREEGGSRNTSSENETSPRHSQVRNLAGRTRRKSDQSKTGTKIMWMATLTGWSWYAP